MTEWKTGERATKPKFRLVGCAPLRVHKLELALNLVTWLGHEGIRERLKGGGVDAAPTSSFDQ